MAFRFNGLLQKRFPSCISGGWKRYAPADAGYYYYFFFCHGAIGHGRLDSIAVIF